MLGIAGELLARAFHGDCGGGKPRFALSGIRYVLVH